MPDTPANNPDLPDIDPALEEALAGLAGDLDADAPPPDGSPKAPNADAPEQTPAGANAPEPDAGPAADPVAGPGVEHDAEPDEIIAAIEQLVSEDAARAPTPAASTPEPGTPDDAAALDEAIASLLDAEDGAGITPPELETLATTAQPAPAIPEPEPEHPEPDAPSEPAAVQATEPPESPEPVAGDAPDTDELEGEFLAPGQIVTPEPAPTPRTTAADWLGKARARLAAAIINALPMGKRAAGLGARAARRAEPTVLGAFRKAAAALDKLGPSARDSVGWLALGTMFIAVCVWGYALMRRPAAPMYEDVPAGMVSSDQTPSPTPPATDG